MDVDDLDKQIALRKDRPVIINANIGTTMKGAVDDTRSIYRVLAKHDKLHSYYMHLDGALMGFVLPFLEKDLKFLRHAHSISISGHKFLGVPFPCGVFLVEKRFVSLISQPVEYIGRSVYGSTDRRIGSSALALEPFCSFFLFVRYMLTLSHVYSLRYTRT